MHLSKSNTVRVDSSVLLLISKYSMCDSDTSKLVSFHKLDEEISHVGSFDCSSDIDGRQTSIISGLVTMRGNCSIVPHDIISVSIKVSSAKLTW